MSSPASEATPTAALPHPSVSPVTPFDNAEGSVAPSYLVTSSRMKMSRPLKLPNFVASRRPKRKHPCVFTFFVFFGPWTSRFCDTLWSPGRDHSEIICGTDGQTPPPRDFAGTLSGKGNGDFSLAPRRRLQRPVNELEAGVLRQGGISVVLDHSGCSSRSSRCL